MSFSSPSSPSSPKNTPNPNAVIKTALFIAFAFPPVSGGGVQRPSKFVKYLPLFNWSSIVLTSLDANQKFLDYTLFNEIKNKCQIKKIKAWPIPSEKHHLFARVHRKIYKIFQILFTNDIGWVPFIIWAGVKTIRQEKIDLIFATGNPFGSFIAGTILSKIFKIPLVLDYRDSWSFSEYAWEQGTLRKIMSRFWERQTLKQSSAVIVVKPKMIDHVKAILPSAKIFLITNGYDEDDFSSAIKNTTAKKKLTIVLTGVLWPNVHHSPKSFICALLELIHENKIERNQIEINIYGDVSEYYQNQFAQLGVCDLIHLKGHVHHEEAIIAQVNADILLLLIESDYGYKDSLTYSGIIPGKIFEYAASKTPMLAIIPENNAFEASFIKELNCGLIAQSNNVSDIKEKLLVLIQKRHHLALNTDKLLEYSRRVLTQKLTTIFDDTFKQQLNQLFIDE